jgi:hypothetical protein
VLRRALAIVAGKLIIGAAGLLTGVRAIWSGTSPKAEQTLYFANHTSHGDFVLLWATLPPDLRALTRPVAGQDYWDGLEAAQLHRRRRVQRADDPPRRLGPGRQPGRPDEGGAGRRRLAHHVPRGHAQHRRRHPAAAEERPLSPGARLPQRAAGAGVDREPEARAAQGHAGADSAGLHGALRHADGAGRGEDKNTFIARARAAMLDLRPEYDRNDKAEGAAS